MEWEEFLRQEAQQHGLSLEEEETLLLALPTPSQQRTQSQLATQFYVNSNTQKKRFERIYQKFASSCQGLLDMGGAGKLKYLHTNYLRKKFSSLQEPGNGNDISRSTHTQQFDALIDDKTKRFVGRDYVYRAFDEFTTSYPKGYFTVVGDPGEGKSAIAAQYIDAVAKRDCIYYFNVYSDSQNRANQFLENVCLQLIERYSLDYSKLPERATEDGVFFKDLLQTVSNQLPQNEKLVIVVDGLDEVDLKSQADGANVLYLPRYLPDNVYFFLTRRRELEARLLFEAPERIFDLKDYEQECQQDVKEYIRLFFEDEQYKNKLNQWIATQDLTKEAFVEYLAEKSENNFMYLRYVIPQIADGFYQDLSLDKLPQGLMAYYEDHWRRMGMTASPLPRVKINIVYILAETYEPVSRQLISEYATVDSLQVNELTVQEVLNEWLQFLHQQEIEGETCYRVYHASFIDFLHRKDIVKAAGVEISNIHGDIADTLWEGLYGEEV